MTKLRQTLDMDILWTKSGFHICFHVQTLSYWTKSGQILDFHVQYMSKSFMIGQGFDRHWTGLDSDWTDLVNFPAFGQTLDRGWTWFGFCVQALSNQPSLRSTQFRGLCVMCSNESYEVSTLIWICCMYG